MIPRLFLFSLILFCLELGVFLVILPWTSLWERNYFLFRFPALAPWLLNHYLRGALSGLGLVDIGLGSWYVAHFREVLEGLVVASPSSPAPRARLEGPGGSVRRGQTA